MLELEDFYQNHMNNTNNFLPKSKDILFTGCSIFINDYLIDLIEEAGGNIVFFDTWVGFNYYSQTFNDEILNSSKEPIDLLTQRFKNNIYGDHSVPHFLENKILKLA